MYVSTRPLGLRRSSASGSTRGETMDMPEERLTENLLARLRAAASPQEYLDADVTIDRTLKSYLDDLLAQKNAKRAAVIRAAGVHPTVAYDIFSGKCTHPGRDKLIMIAFGLGCTLVETQRMLRLAGVSELWAKVRRDAVIIWCIDHGMTRTACDDELWNFGEKTLLGTGPLRR